jgi:hypothetical protein
MICPTVESQPAKVRANLAGRRPQRLFAWLLGMLVAATTGLPAQAQYTGLVDALDILSAYRNLHPQVSAAYDQLLAHVPPAMRSQVQAADWAARQSNMTPKQWEDAATDNDMRFVQTPDGLLAIPSDKLKSAIGGLTEFAIDQKATGEILTKVKEQFPEQMQGVAGPIISGLEAARTSTGLARTVAAGTVSGLIRIFVANQIDAESEEIRTKLLNDVTTTLSEARRRGADLKTKVAGLANKVPNMPGVPGAAPAQSPRTAGPPPPIAAPANDPELVARLDQAFAELDAATAEFERKIAEDQRQCQRTADALKADNPDGIQGRTTALKNAIEKAIEASRPDLVGDQVAYNEFRSQIDTLERIVGQAQNAADLVCSNSQAADPDLAAVTDGVLKTRNLGILAGRIADSARDAAVRLNDRFGSIEDLRRHWQTSDRLGGEFEKLQNFCFGVATPIPEAVTRMYPMQVPSGKILGGLLEADTGKLTPELTATYSARNDDHFARVAAITRRIDYEACNSQRQALRKMCPTSGPWGGSIDPILLSLGTLRKALGKFASDRAEQADRIKAEAQQIETALVQMVKAEAASRRCADDAERRKKSGGTIALIPPVTPPGPTVSPPPLPLPGPAPTTGPTTGPTIAPAPPPKTGPGPTTGLPPAPAPAPDKPAVRAPDDKRAAPDCDPARAPKPKPDIAKGFVPVPYKGATAWTGATNPDCPPFGAPAKGADDGLPTGEPKSGAIPPACGRAEAAIERGRQHYLAGRVTEYRVALVNAERELGRLKDSDACKDQRAKIAKGAAQSDLLENVIKAANQALANCNETNLRKLSGLLSKTNHPHVAELRQRAERMATIASRIDLADAARSNGRAGDASNNYRLAAAALNASPGLCPNLAQRVRDGLRHVKVTSLHYSPVVTGLAAATNNCRSTYGERGMAVPNPDSLTGYTCDCTDPFRFDGNACVREKSTHERADAAHEACRNSFGKAAFAQPKDSSYREYGCLCAKGHVWNKSNTQCVEQTQEQIIADANRRCQIANKNKRARAAKYLGNDQWSCVVDRSRAQVMAEAHRSCQRANGNDRRVRATSRRADGRWNCAIPSQRRHAQPDYNAAASAAAAAAIIQGLGAMMRHQTVRPPSYRTGGHHHLR